MSKRKEIPQLLISDTRGRIYNLPDLEAAGMKGGHFFRLPAKDLVKLPSGSELFMLPARAPVGYQRRTRSFIALDENPFSRKHQRCFALAAFISPGYTVSYSSAYREIRPAESLPIFSYAAVSFYKGEFYVPATRTDRQRRQDLRLMDVNLVRKNAAKLKKVFAHNRLFKHLVNCALVYGCPAARNFFLSRYEAPLPTSPLCNARCAGCISDQPDKSCPATQPRIKFVPYPEEVAEVALFHLENVKDPIVSFGQGCEGEPLLVADVLAESIRLIRKRTAKGIINLNTNASRPKMLAKLFDCGLDSIRVSLNSVRQDYYTRYYQPRGYAFGDVRESIKIAKKKKKLVWLNYLTMPGFTDAPDEFAALKNFIATEHIDMIQWRNLNFDPLRYFRILKAAVVSSQMLGIREMLKVLKKAFPKLMMGYFNPSKLRIKRRIKNEP